LAPLAVAPELQRRGIGSALVEAGLREAHGAGYEAVVVLGPADYYPRFGFIAAGRYGLRSEYDTADDSFMAVELVPGALDGCSGLVKYPPEFSG
jgi:putative acetyltransferase